MASRLSPRAVPPFSSNSQKMLLLTISALFLGLTIASPLEKRDGWKIPSTTFDSQANFDQYFSYAYPWGNTHNGAARMDNAHVSVGGGQLTLTADYTTGQPAAGSLAIHYLSGTVYGKESFTIKAGGGYDFSGQFLAPVAKGTWPAFWLTGVNGWPPEIDLAEWKGSGKVSFNTLATDKVYVVHLP